MIAATLALALQAAPTLTVDRVEAERLATQPITIAKAIVTVENTTGRTIASGWVECTFTREGEPVAVGRQPVNDLAPGASQTLEIDDFDAPQFDGARCNISRLRYD